MEVSNNNFLGQRQGQSLSLHTLIFLWINLRLTSLKLKHYKLYCGLGISMFSFYGLMEKKILNGFQTTINYDHNIKCTHEYSKNKILFLHLKVGIKNCYITTDLYVKDTDRHQYLHYTSAHFYHTKRSVVLAKLFALVICVHLKKTLRDTWLE